MKRNVDTFKAMLRPVIEDAAQSLEYAHGLSAAAVVRWFDDAAPEDLQGEIMGRVQDGILAAMGTTREALDAE